MTIDSDAAHKAPKMLIADDDPAIVQMLANRCVNMGFQVDTAGNGMQSLIKARQWKPDVLIVDVNMPELDGLSVCAKLLEPRGISVDVIVITGYTDPETIERCESFGAFYARKGRDFWIRIRAALEELFPHMADKIEEVVVQATKDRVPEHPRVLVVDDDSNTEKILASRLRKYGVDTLYAPDAVHGCRLAGKEKPSVIIVDNFIPDGDAKFLLHRLRSAPATARVPVIVMSKRPLDASEEQRLKHEISGLPGAVHVIKKSFDTNELFGAIRRFCSFAKHVDGVEPPVPTAPTQYLQRDDALTQ